MWIFCKSRGMNSEEALTPGQTRLPQYFPFHSSTAAMAEGTREEQFLIQQQEYKTNAFTFILKVLEWCKTNETKALVDEMLHSIFFLAKICQVPFSPEEIIPDPEILKALKKAYPGPFGALSQFPKRTPFSSVLDMVVLMEKPENESKIKKSLKNIVNSVQKTFPVSSTLCVSENTKTSTRHYGVSMSTTGPLTRRIMIAASCSGPWDDYVAGAVISHLPNDMREKDFEDYEGTIRLPDYVRCEAFDISDGTGKPPCRSCGIVFGLPTTEITEWPYGNCAENESVSKLLKHDIGVKKDVRPTFTPEIRKKAQQGVRERLRKRMQNTPWRMKWKGDFYSPQI